MALREVGFSFRAFRQRLSMASFFALQARRAVFSYGALRREPIAGPKRIHALETAGFWIEPDGRRVRLE